MDYRRVLDEIFGSCEAPKFSVRLWNTEECFYGSGDSTTFTLVVDHQQTLQRLLARGSLGFGESYMEGRLRIEGDLEAYLRLRHQFKKVRRSLRLMAAMLLARRSIPKVRKEQITYHYDLGNTFFQQLLDAETMSYSAGHYERGTENLATAQHQKLALMCHLLELPSEASVLDLGCGWGGFAVYAAENFHWRIAGLTLSKAQFDYSRTLATHYDPEHKISFEQRDMIESLPASLFDGVVMIESLEHVGQHRLASFFRHVKSILKPGGPLVIQTTGRYQPRPLDHWTQKYVFPGGYLPSKDEVLTAAHDAGFTLEEFRDDTEDYLHTMSAWIHNLENHRVSIEQHFGQPFYRLWELWMHGAKVGFEADTMNLFRLRLRCSL